MAEYDYPVLHFAEFGDKDTPGTAAYMLKAEGLYVKAGRYGWVLGPAVIRNFNGPNNESLRVINVAADPQAQPPVAEELAEGWFCGLNMDSESVPGSLATALSEGDAAVAAAVSVEPSLAQFAAMTGGGALA